MVSVFHVVQVERYSASLKRVPNCDAQNSFEVFPVIVAASQRDKKQTFVRQMICPLKDIFMLSSLHILSFFRSWIAWILWSCLWGQQYTNRPCKVFSLTGTCFAIHQTPCLYCFFGPICPHTTGHKLMSKSFYFLALIVTKTCFSKRQFCKKYYGAHMKDIKAKWIQTD